MWLWGPIPVVPLQRGAPKAQGTHTAGEEVTRPHTPED